MTPDAGQQRAYHKRAIMDMCGVAVAVLALDAVSKALVLERLPGHPVPLLGGLVTLNLTFNTGAAFGLGTSYTAVIALIVCGVVDWINLPHFPWTFNLADAAISCAAVLIAGLALRGIRIDGTSAAHAVDAGPTRT